MNLSWVQSVLVVDSMRVLQNGLLVIFKVSSLGFESLSINSMQLNVAKSQPIPRPQLISSAWKGFKIALLLIVFKTVSFLLVNYLNKLRIVLLKVKLSRQHSHSNYPISSSFKMKRMLSLEKVILMWLNYWFIDTHDKGIKIIIILQR